MCGRKQERVEVCAVLHMPVSTVPENSGMSVDSNNCWDGLVDMSAANVKKGVSECLLYMHVRRSVICT